MVWHPFLGWDVVGQVSLSKCFIVRFIGGIMVWLGESLFLHLSVSRVKFYLFTKEASYFHEALRMKGSTVVKGLAHADELGSIPNSGTMCED